MGEAPDVAEGQLKMSRADRRWLVTCVCRWAHSYLGCTSGRRNRLCINRYLWSIYDVLLQLVLPAPLKVREPWPERPKDPPTIIQLVEGRAALQTVARGP